MVILCLFHHLPHPTPPRSPIHIPLCSVLLCTSPHKVRSMDGIISCLCPMASGGYWQEVGGQEGDGKVSIYSPALFLLGLLFESGYVPTATLQLLCSCPSWLYCPLPLCLQNRSGNNSFLLVSPGCFTILY